MSVDLRLGYHRVAVHRASGSPRHAGLQAPRQAGSLLLPRTAINSYNRAERVRLTSTPSLLTILDGILPCRRQRLRTLLPSLRNGLLPREHHQPPTLHAIHLTQLQLPLAAGLASLQRPRRSSPSELHRRRCNSIRQLHLRERILLVSAGNINQSCNIYGGRETAHPQVCQATSQVFRCDSLDLALPLDFLLRRLRTTKEDINTLLLHLHLRNPSLTTVLRSCRRSLPPCSWILELHFIQHRRGKRSPDLIQCPHHIKASLPTKVNGRVEQYSLIGLCRLCRPTHPNTAFSLSASRIYANQAFRASPLSACLHSVTWT